jgi:hypothetical protein
LYRKQLARRLRSDGPLEARDISTLAQVLAQALPPA